MGEVDDDDDDDDDDEDEDEDGDGDGDEDEDEDEDEFEYEELIMSDLSQVEMDAAFDSCPPLHQLLTEEICGVLLDFADLHGLSTDYPIIYRNYRVQVRCIILGMTGQEISHAFSTANSRRVTLRDDRDILRQYGRDYGIRVSFRGVRRIIQIGEEAQRHDYKAQKRIARQFDKRKLRDAQLCGVAKNYVAYMRRAI
jgi:hypothetical protein